MKHSIKQELEDYILNCVNDEVISNDNKEGWHHYLFNESFYIIGYYEAEQWLKKHNVSAFEAIEKCIEYKKDNFGEVNKTYSYAEQTVNMYVYILGEELLQELDAENIEELKEKLTYQLEKVD